MADVSFFNKLLPSGFFELWKKGDQGIVGIDFGSSSVKAVQLEKKQERAVLKTYGELRTTHYGNAEEGRAVKLTEEKAVELLNDLLREANVTTTQAVMSIPLRSSFVTLITFPPMTDSELAKAVPLEARRYIPVPISEVIIDWWSIPEGLRLRSRQEMDTDKELEHEEVLLVAIHKDVIEKYRALSQKLGLHVRAFEIEVFSTVRSTVERSADPLLVIDLGASTTKMIMVDRGIIRSTHSIDQGAQDLTLAISRSLGISFSRAEALKKEVGLSPKPEHKETVSIIEPLLDSMFTEASGVALDYRRRYNRFMSRVLLTGGGALLNGVVEQAVRRFGVEAERVHAFSKVQYPAFLEPVLKNVGPSFAVASGLALRELE